jgi:hypothetical protein
MKRLKNIGELIIIWLVSIFCFTVFFSIYGTSLFLKTPSFNSVEIIFTYAIIFVFTFIFSCLASLPAFIVFALAGFLILQIPMHIHLKRVLMLVVNYTGILVTCAITFAFIAVSSEPSGFLYPLQKYVLWYPNWALILSSTAAILFMPLGHKSPLQQIIQK